MTDQPKTSDVLNRGADLIEKHGHHKGGYGSPAEGFCIMGACNHAAGQMDFSASQAVTAYLGESEGIIAFNDADERTAEDVVEVLRAAAVIEAAKETANERASVTA